MNFRNVLNNMSEKYCKDCKFYRRASYTGDECHHPSVLTIFYKNNVVTGKEYWSVEYHLGQYQCYALRQMYGKCGVEAKMFGLNTDKNWFGKIKIKGIYDR